MKKAAPAAKGAPSAAPAAKRPAAVTAAVASQPSSDPMLMDTYQSEEPPCDIGNDLDDFEARLANPIRRAVGPAKRASAPQFKVHQPTKAPAPVVFRKGNGPSGPALAEDNDAPDTRSQDVQDVRNLGGNDENSDDD
jgi:hypothetical protein